MCKWLNIILGTLRSSIHSQHELALENLALRQQLAALKFRGSRPRLSDFSVPFPLRFLFASQPKIMGKALGIVYRTIATQLSHKAGYKNSTAHTGAVTLIQRFGSALNLDKQA